MDGPGEGTGGVMITPWPLQEKLESVKRALLTSSTRCMCPAIVTLPGPSCNHPLRIDSESCDAPFVDVFRGGGLCWVVWVVISTNLNATLV